MEAELEGGGRIKDRRCGKDQNARSSMKEPPISKTRQIRIIMRVAVERERDNPIRRCLGMGGHSDKMAEYGGACDEHEEHDSRAEGLFHRLYVCLEGHITLCDCQKEDRQRSRPLLPPWG